MKRLLIVTAGVALLAALAATWSLAAPTESAREAAPAAKAATLPALPANIRNRRRWIIGVKCDAPPFGYINVQGNNAGFDVEIAKWFSRYAFGRDSRVTYVCAPTAVRESLLTTDRADLIISTFTYTADRDTRIDFSRAYYKATGRLLVKNDSPIQSLGDIAGKRIATTSGSIYDRWVRRCFSGAQLTVFDGITNALLAFNQGRADAVMWDDTVLVGQAAADRSSKLTNDTFLALPYGIGIKQGNTAVTRWVNSRLELMRKRDTFNTILKNSVPPRVFTTFQKNILRPDNRFGYSQGDLTTQCP
jgi:polar amino acid transport system substrate-binding protein